MFPRTPRRWARRGGTCRASSRARVLTCTAWRCPCWATSWTGRATRSTPTPRTTVGRSSRYQQLYVAPCADIQQGRSICRALYDFYKISGHIETVTDPEEEELVRVITRASNEGSQRFHNHPDACQEDDVGEEESVAPDTDNPEVKTRPDFTFPPDIFVKQPPAEVDKAYDEGM